MSKLPEWMEFLIGEYVRDAKQRPFANHEFMIKHFEDTLEITLEVMMRAAQAYVADDHIYFPHIGQLRPYTEAEMYRFGGGIIHTDDELKAIEEKYGTMRTEVEIEAEIEKARQEIPKMLKDWRIRNEQSVSKHS